MSEFVNAGDLTFLEKMLKEATSEEYESITKGDWYGLKMHATNFIQAYNSLLLQETQLDQKYLKSIINSPESITHIKNLRGSQKAFIIRSKYLLAFNFDRYLTNFLGELPKEAIYVFEDSSGVSSYKMSLIELAKRATSEGRLKVSKNQLTKDNRKSLEELEKDNELPNEHIAKVQSAYAAVNARLGRYYEKMGQTGAAAQGGLLMWKANHSWTIARVNNKGDLKEAYVAALMAKHQSKLDKLMGVAPGAPAFYSDEIVATFFNNYIYNVTNKAAITGEDVITSTGQYSIKSAGAEMPSLRQYVMVAEWIMSQQRLFSPTEVKGYIDSAFSADTHRNIIVNKIDNLGNKTLDEILSLIKV